jgi:hypothetical protein
MHFDLPGQISSISLPGKTPSWAMRAHILRPPFILHTLNFSQPLAVDNGVVFPGGGLFVMLPVTFLILQGQEIFGGFPVTRHLNKKC